jgi:flagellar motor protein MotB
MKVRSNAKENRAEGEHGYLASVSDLMAVLFFLMMIILIVFAAMWASLTSSRDWQAREIQRLTRQGESDREEIRRLEALVSNADPELRRLKDLEARYRDAVSEYDSLNAEIVDSRNVRSVFLQNIERNMRSENKVVEIDADEGVFRFPDDVLFDSGDFKLKDRGKEALDSLAGILARIMPCYAGSRDSRYSAKCPDRRQFKPGRFDVILIEGHTDDVPIKTMKIDDNLQLSTFRSWSTYSHLMESAPALAELRNGSGEHLFGMSGYGENRPTVPNEGREEKRRLNRRVDFRIVLAAPEPTGADTGRFRD